MLRLIFVLFYIVYFSIIPVFATEKPTAHDKQSIAGNYLTAKEAFDLKQQKGDKVLLVDVRTPSELVYIGVAKNVDVNIPFLKLDYNSWDDKKQSFKEVPNDQFVTEMNAILKSKNMFRNSSIILLCRSGKRSAKASNLLTIHGYTNVYTVTEGFEGDKAKAGENKGKRVVNGWKNANLPWHYKLDRKLFTSK